jgi:PAS domain S-box-containing protein
MEDFGFVNQLPDAICIIDPNGEIKQSNAQFKSKIQNGYNGDLDMVPGTREIHLNFVKDILHPDFITGYVEALKMIQSSDSCKTVTLGLLKTLTVTAEKKFPLYRSIHWTVSSMEKQNLFILIGRDPDIISVNTNEMALASKECHTQKSFGCVPSFQKELQDRDQTMVDELVDFFQNAPISLHWLSSTGLILWANDTELISLGYTAEEYIGHSITEFLMPGEDGRLQLVFGELMAGATVHNAPFKFRAKTGETKYLIVDSNVNFSEDGSFRHTR